MDLQNQLHLPSTRQRNDGQNTHHQTHPVLSALEDDGRIRNAQRNRKYRSRRALIKPLLGAILFVATASAITTLETTPAQAAEKPVGTWARTTASATYVRIRPSSNTPCVAKVPRGTQVMAWGTYAGWYRVEIPGGKFGWIYNTLLNVSNADKLQALSHYKAKQASDRTGKQMMYGDADQLRSYYAKYRASGALLGLRKMGLSLTKTSPKPRVAQERVVAKTVSAVVDSSKSVEAMLEPMSPSKIPKAQGKVTPSDIIAARNAYLHNQLASRHKTRPSAPAAKVQIRSTPKVRPTSLIQKKSTPKKVVSRGGSPRDYARYAAANNMVKKALSYRGRPYISGGTSPSGFDCSGLVYYLLRQRGYNPPRTAAGYAHWGKPVKKSDLKPGDLVLFANTYKHGISHIGVYSGNNKFVHAANHRSGVKVSSLSSSYYSKKYWGARRP